MAKSKESSVKEVVAEIVPVDDSSSSTEVELLQVDVGDVVKLKQVLDESVAHALLDESGAPHLTGHYGHDNVKLILMTVACAFAVVAQFAPLPFPDSRPVLGLCCGAYFLLSFVLQLITAFVDKDCIMITKKLDAPPAGGKNALLAKYGIRVRTQLPRFSEFYTVILEFQGYGKAKGEGKTLYSIKTWSVGKFFDVDGFFAEDRLVEEVEGLYSSFVKGEFGKPEDHDDGHYGIFALLGVPVLDDIFARKKQKKD